MGTLTAADYRFLRSATECQRKLNIVDNQVWIRKLLARIDELEAENGRLRKRREELKKRLYPLKKLTVHADGTQTISHVSKDAVDYEYLLRCVAKTYCDYTCPSDAEVEDVHEAICADVRAKLGISPKGSLKALRPLAGACLAPGDFSPVEVTVYCGQCGDEIEKAATCGKCPGRKQEEN